MDLKNINSTFSFKSDTVLADIMQKNNLDGSEAQIILTKITMMFSRGEILEQEMIGLIQKEVNVSPQAAQQMAKEIQEKLIPTLWDKMPSAERDALLNGTNIKPIAPEMPNIKAPAFLNVDDNKKLLETEREAPKSGRPDLLTPPQKIKKYQPAGLNRLPKKPLTENKPRPSGPDKYREEL